MTKKAYIIISASFFIIFVAVLVVFIIKKPQTIINTPLDSIELRTARLTYALKKVETEEEPYYIITDLTNAGRENVKLTIPDAIDNIKITKIISKEREFIEYWNVKIIEIGPNINYIGTNENAEAGNIGDKFFKEATNLDTIIVDSRNETFSSSQGLLYNKDQTILLRYPMSSTISNVRTFELPAGLIKINDFAFANVTSFQTIVFNDTLQEIGNHAFDNCESLKQLDFSENNQQLTKIGNYAFYKCSNLVQIELPLSVTSLGNSVFSLCSKLSILIIHSSLTNFGTSILAGSPNANVYTETANLSNLQALAPNFGINISRILDSHTLQPSS